MACRPKVTEHGQAFRDVQLEQELLLEAQKPWSRRAQFGGKYFAHDIRVIRLPRHGASCPVGMGVSCSADRNIKAKINRDGIWIEKLESNPGKYIPEHLRQAGEGEAVKVNLNQPMSEILRSAVAVSGVHPPVAERDYHRRPRYRPR